MTARAGEPHVRVYSEERDRPTLIVVDQRMSMFWGTAHNMKSVTAAECAAIVAFRILAQGDRVGGIVFGDRDIAEVRPQRTRAALNRVLNRIALANSALGAEVEAPTPTPINAVLKAVRRIAKRDHLVIILSDFDAVDDQTRHLLGGIAQRNDLVLGLVTDPSAHDLSPGGQLTVSDGRLQVEVDLGDTGQREAVLQVSHDRLARVLDWQNHMNVSILPLSASEETLPQLQALLLGRPR